MPSSRFTIAFFLSLFVLSLFLIGRLFWQLLTPLVLALVLLSIFHPLYSRIKGVFKSLFLNKKDRFASIISASLVSLIIVLCVVIPILILVFLLSQQAQELYESASNGTVLDKLLTVLNGNHPLMVKFQDYLKQLGIYLTGDQIAGSSTSIMRSIGLVIYQNISNIVSNLLGLGVNFAIMMVIVFTLLVSGPSLKQYFVEVSPLPEDEQERLMVQFSQISRAVFVGNGIVAICEGILGGLGMYWFNLGPGLFWGVVIAFAAFMPVVGIFIVVVPAALLLYMDGNTLLAVVFVIYNIFYSVLLEGLLKPHIIGSHTRIHAVLVFLAVYAGIQVHGILGLFYGPLWVTMLLSLVEIYKEHYKDNLLKSS